MRYAQIPARQARLGRNLSFGQGDLFDQRQVFQISVGMEARNEMEDVLTTAAAFGKVNNITITQFVEKPGFGKAIVGNFLASPKICWCRKLEEISAQYKLHWGAQ